MAEILQEWSYIRGKMNIIRKGLAKKDKRIVWFVMFSTKGKRSPEGIFLDTVLLKFSNRSLFLKARCPNKSTEVILL